jgi:methyl-accepting chemotaxis protein
MENNPAKPAIRYRLKDMRATIRNKLIWGLCGVMTLLAAVAAIGVYAVFSLRHSAQDATRIGGKLNGIALEIQVHNLEAERRVRSYLLQVKSLGTEKAREQYLDEADIEIADIESLASKAVSISPTADKRSKFQKIVDGVGSYKAALAATVAAAEKNPESQETKTYKIAYDKAAEVLHDNAEDGEVAGRESSENSQEDIDRTSTRSVTMAVGVSLIGMILGILMSYKLSRAILVPVDHLKEVAENVSLGNLNIAVRRYSNDEIGDLADSFSRMVTAVRFFRMEAEAVQAGSEDAGDEGK